MLRVSLGCVFILKMHVGLSLGYPGRKKRQAGGHECHCQFSLPKNTQGSEPLKKRRKWRRFLDRDASGFFAEGKAAAAFGPEARSPDRARRRQSHLPEAGDRDPRKRRRANGGRNGGTHKAGGTCFWLFLEFFELCAEKPPGLMFSGFV